MSKSVRLAGNPFYAPWFLSALEHLPGAQHEFLPGVPHLPLRKLGWPGSRAYEALITPYSPLTLPREPVALATMAGAKGLRYLRLSMLPADAAGEELLAALESAGARITVLSRHERAMVATGLAAEDYFMSVMSQKRRKRAREARNRLARLGDLTFSTARSHDERLAYLQAFRKLEGAGWKGRKGTAFSAQQAANTFLEALVRGAPDQALSLHLLHAGGEPVGAGIVLYDGHAAWYWKTAYDETHAHASPGVVFTLELTRHLIDERGVRIIDSCAMPDHPMINSLWGERLPILDVLIDFSPSRPALLPPLLKGLLAARTRAKRLKHRR